LLGDELRALRRLQRHSVPSPFLFVSERGTPFTTAGFARMIERPAVGAGLELKARPHMLRHACGCALANKGHDTRAIQGWLGHRSITSTAVYTALAQPVQGFLEGVKTRDLLDNVDSTNEKTGPPGVFTFLA
jgi:site-specific recombinase XerD